MGQTLTHGVYLPDEGERNCYSGLAANWGILDGAVGTVAEHTTQIAGKAPLVHTHTVSQITDFPAYGNAAGTICEGNDARLSDARTPVAHTHTKADITDLFNSANTWTGGNTYTASIIYQSNHALGNLPQSVDSQTTLKINDSTGTNYLAQITTYQSTDSTGFRIVIRDKFDSNGFSPSGNNRNKYFNFLQNAANQSYIQWDGYANNSIVPLANNTYALGTSTNKWKTINGVNPGALSLPKNAYDNINTDNWVLTGASFTYTPAIDGYLQINVNPNSNNIARVSIESTFFRMASESSIGNNAMLTIPVRADIRYGIRLIGASIAQARITPAEGNV